MTGERDFVHQNIVDAGTHGKPSAPQTDDAKFLQKSDYGKVPTYLHERKMELAATYARQQVWPEAVLRTSTRVFASNNVHGDKLQHILS